MWSSDPDRAPVFLSWGFRPFFLLAALQAILAMAAWTIWLGVHAAGGAVTRLTIAVPPHLWHGHEMIFGYGAAAVAGFMLTAVPGWTGERRVAGPALAGIAALWLAGRIAMASSAILPAVLVAVLDLAFLPALAGLVAASLLKRPAGRNLVFVALMALLTLANAMVHSEWLGFAGDLASRGLATGIVTLALIIVIVGGRVTPAFTRNELIRRADERLPRSLPALDAAGIVSAALVALATLVAAPAEIVGSAAALAAIANGARLSLWRGRAVLRQPILWSLHLGYGFAVAGFAALGLAHLAGGIGDTAALHLLAIGAVGGMTLAVMTRAALGHTNRPLVVRPAIALAYGLVALAALLRLIGATGLAGDYLGMMVASGTSWVLAFVLFLAIYWPVLTGPAAAPPAAVVKRPAA